MASKEREAGGESHRLTDAELNEQMRAAAVREEQSYADGQRAISASYDATTERVALELSNGLAIAFPARIVKGLENATAAQRAQLSLSPAGSGVMWDELDTDISVPGLLAKLFCGSVAREFGRTGGRAKSDAKAKAAKANGAKGGRPRKKPALRTS